MKNKLYLLLLLLVIPFCASAAGTGAHCDVIKGTGNDIGDEINCAGEHFYIIDKANNKTKMLAKYNLYAGQIELNLFVSDERYDQLVNAHKSESGRSIISTIFNEPEFAPYQQYFIGLNGLQIIDRTQPKHFNIYGNIYEKDVNTEKSLVHQSELAIGAHGTELGRPDPLQIGVFGYATPTNIIDEYEEYFGDFDDQFKSKLSMELYEEYLNDRNIFVDNMDAITVKELRDIIFKISGRQIPLKEWFRNQQRVTSGVNQIHLDMFVLGDLKEYVPAGYEWLYSTTYWTRTAASDFGYEWFSHNRNDSLTSHVFFVDTLGYLCSKYACDTAIGAGSRPVVTIDDSLLRYGIYTKVSGSGTIEVVSSAIPGELINFTIKANKDLELRKLAIITPSGERIEFTENDITYNEDGTITIRSNSFIMPKESVTIEAEWSDYVKGVEDNPKTGYINYILVINVLLVIALGIFITINKEDKFKQI